MPETYKFESATVAWEKLTEAGFSMQRVANDITVVFEQKGFPAESVSGESVVAKLGKDGAIELMEGGQRHHDKIMMLLQG
jgi:hypothetical protein